MPYADSGASRFLSHRSNSDPVLRRAVGAGGVAGAVSCAADGADCGRECRAGVEPVRGGVVCGALESTSAAGAGQLERTAPASRMDAGAGHDSSSPVGGRGGVGGRGVGCRVCPLAEDAAGDDGRCAGRAAGPGTGVRATGRVAGRVGVWDGNSSAVGGDVHQSAGRALERDPAGHSIASGAGLRGAGFPDPLDCSAGGFAGAAAAGRCGRVVAAGSGRGYLHDRVVARSGGPRRAAGRRAGWAAGGGDPVCACRGAGAA